MQAANCNVIGVRGVTDGMSAERRRCSYTSGTVVGRRPWRECELRRLTAVLAAVIVVLVATCSAAAAAEPEEEDRSAMLNDGPVSLSDMDIFVNDGDAVEVDRRQQQQQRRVVAQPDVVESVSHINGGGQSRSLLHAIAAATSDDANTGDGGGVSSNTDGEGHDPCYENDDRRTPRRCVPDFDNAAYGRPIEASSTCGSPPVRFCTGGGGGGSGMSISGASSGSNRGCFVCDSSNTRRRHPASYINDHHNPTDVTCWLSEPIFPYRSNQVPQPQQHQHQRQHHYQSLHQYPQHQQLLQRQPQNVTVTLSLGKKFEVRVQYIHLCNF
jgi:hypothetical protein